MNKHLLLFCLLATAFSLWGQATEISLEDLDLSDVVVIGGESAVVESDPSFVTSDEMPSASVEDRVDVVVESPETDVVFDQMLEAPSVSDLRIEPLVDINTLTSSAPVELTSSDQSVDSAAEGVGPDNVITTTELPDAVLGQVDSVVTLETSEDTVLMAVDVDLYAEPQDSATEEVATDALETSLTSDERAELVEQPVIPVVETALPEGADIVLEMPTRAPEEIVTLGEMAQTEEDETISVDFPDEEVRSILRTVADLYDLNIIIPETMQGRTSIKLKNVTWKQVFEVILDPLGFTYVEDRNIIRIKSTEELTAEPVDTRVFVVNYARAAELQGTISTLVDAAIGGKIQVDNRSNALVITERPSRMNKIQNTIERLDQPNSQVMIESRFVEVSEGTDNEIGINWAHINSSPGDLLGGNALGSGSSGGFDVAADPLNASGLLAVFSRAEFGAVISALENNNNSELVSQPTVVVMNNKAAKFYVGVQYPIREVVYNPETGLNEPGELTQVPIGIDLNVTPSVNSAGMIGLQIDAKLSELGGVGFPEFVSSIGGQDPVISERTSSTEVTIKDGFTIAIGGLTSMSTDFTDGGVPILMDLPLFGNLFKTRTESQNKTNLIIFITAKTLNPDGTTYREIVDPRALDAIGHSESKVPGYRLSDEELKSLEAAELTREAAQQEKFRSHMMNRKPQ